MEKYCQQLNVGEFHSKRNPFNLSGMREALYRIIKAINNREKIVIYGYYDVDGITSTSVLLLVLKYLNADVEYYIPDKINESHDISSDIIKNHIKFLGAQLIITLGCGINSVNQVELCKKLGIDVIITDYHQGGNILPNAIIINPRQKKCQYYFKELSGVGITYKIAQAISSYYDMKSVHKYLDLVSIGIVSHNVLIFDENRDLVEEGLKQLKITNNYGLQALLRVNRINDIDIFAAYKLALAVVPTVNAIGRMDNARIAVELFTTSNYDRAQQIAKYLYKK